MGQPTQAHSIAISATIFRLPEPIVNSEIRKYFRANVICYRGGGAGIMEIGQRIEYATAIVLSSSDHKEEMLAKQYEGGGSVGIVSEDAR